MLSACAAGGDAIQPEALVSDLGNLSSGRGIAQAAPKDQAAVESAWWSAWGDPQLDRLLTGDAVTAPSIAQAAARLRLASAGLDGAQADRALRLDASGRVTGERFPDHAVYPAPYAGHWGSQGALTASASHALDFWGRRQQVQAAAFSRVEAARAEAQDARLLLRAAVAEAYVGLDTVYRLRDVAVAGLARRQGVVELLATRERAGLATHIETTQAQEAITTTQEEIERLDGEIALHRHQIAALLGRDPAFADALARPSVRAMADPVPVSAVPANLLGARPDIAAARAAVEAAAHDMGAARAGFYPDVNLVAFAGVQSMGLGHLLRAGSSAAGAGPSVTLPIFDGGRLRAQLRGKTAGYDLAVTQYNAALTQALQEVADGLASLSAAHARQRQTRDAVASASRVLQLLRLRERQGLVGAMDRLSAETTLLLAERRATEADGRIAMAQVALIRALGGAWAPSISFSSGSSK